MFYFLITYLDWFGSFNKFNIFNVPLFSTNNLLIFLTVGSIRYSIQFNSIQFYLFRKLDILQGFKLQRSKFNENIFYQINLHEACRKPKVLSPDTLECQNDLKNIVNSISHNATKQLDTPQKSCSFVQDF